MLALGCGQTTHIAKAHVTHYELAEQPVDSEVVALIDPYKVKLDVEMNEVIGQCAVTLTKAKPESTLGNWISDLIAKHAAIKLGAPIDFAVQNYGGIRVSSLAKGPVIMRQVFELMPFENLIVVLHMKGADLVQFLDQMAASHGWPVSSQLRFEISNDRAINVRIGGDPLDSKRTYHFALPDYIANGGDRCFYFESVPRDELPYLIRDAIRDEIKELQAKGLKVTAELDGRITLAQ